MWAQVAEVTYQETLDAAWADHLAPRSKEAPTVVSTFAGIGGSSLGYSMAGYRELLAVEWDAKAATTFQANFHDVPVHQGDITALGVDDLLARIGMMPGELDVLDGSPPCQGFSTSGKRVTDDPRNQLFREFVRLLRGLQPRAFIMENVAGLIGGKMRLAFVDILGELKNSGYQVSARVLDASALGVPQMRKRLIFVGIRDGEASHPGPSTRPIRYHEAVQGLSVTSQMAPVFSDDSRAIWRSTPRGGAHPRHFSWKRLAWGRVANTVVKGPATMHPDEPRHLNVGELRRISTFPDAFVFVGGWFTARAGIGNSVPPLFMRAIAAHVRGIILAEG